MFLSIDNDSYLGIKNIGLRTQLVRKQIKTLVNIPEIKYIEINRAGYGREHVKIKIGTVLFFRFFENEFINSKHTSNK
jgi:hypothetical protein